jgi:uncharacterized membrane protein
MLNLPSSTLTDVFASIGTLVSDLWFLVVASIGVPLAFYVIYQVINMMRDEALEKELDEASEEIHEKFLSGEIDDMEEEDEWTEKRNEIYDKYN